MSDLAESVELVCGGSHARILSRGAELRELRLGGVDLLWSPDAAIWPAVSPILFPIVGRLRDDEVRIGAGASRMNVHGFAAQMRFSIERLDEGAARCLAHDTRQTQAIYPFAFRLTLNFQLSASALSVAVAVENTGDTAMPYACGLHPGFRWPFDGGAPEDYWIAFDQPESPDLPEITADGLFGRGIRRAPMTGDNLPLARDLFAREALCFLNARSAGLLFGAPSGKAIRVELDDFPHWALWSRPPAPFLCIEAWTGHGDPADFTGDVFAKPSMRVLAPGAQARHSAVFSFLNAREPLPMS